MEISPVGIAEIVLLVVIYIAVQRLKTRRSVGVAVISGLALLIGSALLIGFSGKAADDYATPPGIAFFFAPTGMTACFATAVRWYTLTRPGLTSRDSRLIAALSGAAFLILMFSLFWAWLWYAVGLSGQL